MMAFAPGGVTVVTPLGDDPSQLSWQVQSRKGSKLLLTVIDSIGQTGGFTSQFFDVVGMCESGDTSCQPPAPSNPPTVTANVTSTINTCEPWGLTIEGGVKPYNITLAAIASPVITNVTLGPEDDVFTFINRADPNTQLLAAVVDATGQWGLSSQAVKTAGSTDTTCPGLNSVSLTRAEVQEQAAAAAALAADNARKAKTTAVALGIVFGLIVPLILVGIAFWWWRRRKVLSGEVGGQDARPRPWDTEIQQRTMERPSLNLDTSVVRISSQVRRSPSWVVDANRGPARNTDSPTSIDMASTELGTSTVPTPFLTSVQVQSATASMIRSPVSQLPQSAVSMSTRSPLMAPDPAAATPNSTSPAATLSPAQRYRKTLEAYAEAQAARTRLAAAAASPDGSRSSIVNGLPGPSARPLVHRSQSADVRIGSRSFPPQPVQRRAGSSLRLPPVAAIPEVGPDIIIQHRDGGIVEELPPPYPADMRYPDTPGLAPQPGEVGPSSEAASP
ncbi:hypothetical protein C8Q80DRAFT_1111725 [Daedaleopsis nitida]|nr:hypothetical protein C8Q80DRAFT_1111725 [Daedaleopsis nitida]